MKVKAKFNIPYGYAQCKCFNKKNELICHICNKPKKVYEVISQYNVKLFMCNHCKKEYQKELLLECLK